MLKKYLLYLGRWQLSTPILALVLIWLRDFNPTIATVVANFIGGLIFFWIDRFIFRTLAKKPLWEIEKGVACADCGKVGTCYRVVEWLGYNRRDTANPQFRCEVCREAKLQKITPR
jgi:hypothetical protein